MNTTKGQVPGTFSVELRESSAILGDRLPVRVTCPQALSYRQVQIEVFDVAVLNPSSKLGFGTAPKRIADDVLEVEIDTSHLAVGVYEIRLVRLHDPVTPDLEPQLDFVPGRDYQRKAFEVLESTEGRRTAANLIDEIERREAELERQFIAPVDVRKSSDEPAYQYSAFVFVRDILVGTRIRLEHVELVPTHSGLDSRDTLEFVNEFLRSRTRTGVTFNYSEVLRQASRQSNPVCVVHLPAIVASNIEEARDYSVDRTNLLLLALSLSRDAGGLVFDAVVLSRQSREVIKYAVTSPYVGNLLTGHMSGESANALEAYLRGLQGDPTNYFLVGLFREARRERSPDFQYVRYWQILETMAESRNYNPDAPLVDYDGNVMMDNAHTRRIGGSVNIVFNLLRESGIGGTSDTWKNVNIWFAFRNAVAHHGSVVRFSELSRENVKAWAKVGFEENQGTPGYDKFLFALKEDVKLLLMRRLTAHHGPA